MRDYKRRQGVNFSIYFPADEYDDLMALVAEQDEPRASVIRGIIRHHVKRRAAGRIKAQAKRGDPAP